MILRNVNLEVSLKAFGDDDDAAVTATVRRLFEQWAPLIRESDQVSVMLWAADGSEILDYRGELDDTFEWACRVGVANPRHKPAGDPDGVTVHSVSHLYRDNPPPRTYRWLRWLIEQLKVEGEAIGGRPVRVGETFDPGPEFAVSSFKYLRHPEICTSGTMGAGSFVVCYTQLHADDRAYAGFPQGIPEGLPFGTFLGRQCRHFLSDLGFDFLWLSNGFGFGSETWGLRGVLFNGEEFLPGRAGEIHRLNLEFWRLFRAECPDVPLETRGTNLSTGMDLSSDGVPLREIYRGGFGLEPPPNSPWAALNGDFGLELAGWMSHIAELPGETYLYRYYIHDPWFNNSPWLDRYGREPHDIYLPLAVARLDAAGQPQRPTTLSLLTADNSWGEMPDIVPREVVPHLLRGLETAPDRPGPLVWVYPFDEYHDWALGEPNRIEEVFAGDWLLRGAINHGFPLNTVISTRNFAACDPAALDGSILVSPVPAAGSAWEAGLLTALERGGQVLLYGPLRHASERLLSALGVTLGAELDGTFEFDLRLSADQFHAATSTLTTLVHPALFSAGGLEALPPAESATTRVLAVARQNGQERAAALVRTLPDWQCGRLVWVRGSVSCDVKRTSGHYLVQLPESESYPGERLLRLALQAFDWSLLVHKPTADGLNWDRAVKLRGHRTPILTVSRFANAFWFAGYTPIQTVTQHLRLPHGAPLLLGHDTVLVDGHATYAMPAAWRRECRVFVQQTAGEVGCREAPYSDRAHLRRRFEVFGLRDGTLRFFPEPGTAERVRIMLNPTYPYATAEPLPAPLRDEGDGPFFELAGLTGDLVIDW